jgi:DNA-binding GntR family transcriptional regulator
MALGISRVAEARAHVLKALHEGLPPGSAVSVKRTAEVLRISPTPVREALERLVGEGVLVSVPARHGFATPRLTARDVAGLHSLFGTLLREIPTRASADRTPWSPDPGNPIASVRQAVAPAFRCADAAVAIAALQSTDIRLMSHRLVEPAVLGTAWAEGLVDLRIGLETDAERAGRAIDRYVSERISAASAIVAALEDRFAEQGANRFGI